MIFFKGLPKFSPTIMPITISLTTASITLRNEPYITDIMSSFYTGKAVTTSAAKTIFSSFKNIFDSFSRNSVVKHTPIANFAEKFSADSITDVSYPAISTASSFVFTNEQYSLMEKTYANAVFVGIITSKALSIYLV